MVKIVFEETTFHMRQTNATGVWEMRQRIRETADARKEIILCIFSFRPPFSADPFFFHFLVRCTAWWPVPFAFGSRTRVDAPPHLDAAQM